jgi:hypothetical protein
LKKFASVGVSLLVVVVTLSMLAGPADARSRHHGRHHRRGAGPGITCGTGTTNVGGVCVANPTPGPIGNGNVSISPSSITMNLNGSFSASIVVSGLPPLIPVAVTTFTCPTPVAFTVTSPPDALGRMQLVIGEFGGCVPGSYPIVFTETASPFQSFTGFINLHF